MFIQKCFLFLVCIASICVVHGMELDQLPLDQLPVDIVGEIVGQLIKNVGTPALKNEPDIPVIVYHVKKLSLINTSLYRKINSRAVTHAFINLLAHRFDMMPLNVIDKINTPGTREFLNEYLQETGEYELFKVMQQIFNIADEIREEFKQFGFDVGSGQTKMPEQASFVGQTKQGFFLRADIIPRALYTPWGYMKLFDCYDESWLSSKAFYQAFIKHFTLSFMQEIQPMFTHIDTGYYELPSEKQIDLKALLALGEEVLSKDVCKDLSKKEVQEYEGKETLICNANPDLGFMYKIYAINRQPLPDPEEPELYNCRSYDAINFIWKLLQEQYDQENGIKKKRKIDAQVEMHTQSNKQLPKGLLTCIKMAPEVYRAVIAQLDAQPSCETDYVSKKLKVLPLENEYDGRIITILCENALEKVGVGSLRRIHYFGKTDINSFCDATGKDIEQGITETIYLHMGVRASTRELKIAFEKLINELITGWQQTTLVENPDMVNTKSEEEWYLFLKPQVMSKEHLLINFFANSFGLHDKISCHNLWQDKPEIRGYHALHLWIKKKSYDEVAQAFDLNPEMLMQ